MLFNDAVICSGYIVSNDREFNEQRMKCEGFERKRPWPNVVTVGDCLQGLRKTSVSSGKRF